MPFTLCIRGLSLSVFAANAVRTLLLNSGYDPSLELPHHMPTLVLPRSAVRSHSVAPLPSLRGRVAIRELETASVDSIDHDFLGWDLTGLTVTTATSGTPRTIGGMLSATNPDPSAPDWSDLHWVMDVGRFQPQATVAPAAFTIGPITSAIVELSGGTMAGGVPTNGEDANWVWFFSPGITQAVTDTLLWMAPGPTTFELSDTSGRRGAIVVDGQHVGYLVNEATAADIRREVDLFKSTNGSGESPVARHTRGYLQALELPAGQTVFTPVALYKFMGTTAFETAVCIPLRA